MKGTTMQSKEGLGRSLEQYRSTLRSGARRRAVIAVGALAAAITTSALVGVPAASAAPLPGHLVTVFPDRDFVSAEGYTPGQTVAFNVLRAGVSVGVGSAVVDADGLAEVNHPGGGCWSTQPDIVPGDVVSVQESGAAEETTTVQNMSVTANAEQVLAADGSATTTVIVGGLIGPAVDRTQVEQRIVDPRFVNLIGRRDIRAVPGALTVTRQSGKIAWYSSQLTFPDADTFKATYVFSGTSTGNALNAAKIASTASLGERALAWDDATQRGASIAEYGEIGGAIPECGGTATAPLPTSIQDVRVTWKSGSLRVRGTTPKVGQTVVLHKESATTLPALGSDVTVPAVAPHTGGDFDIKVTGSTVNTKPRELWLTTPDGLVDGPILVG
jgi:hypothetical protein